MPLAFRLLLSGKQRMKLFKISLTTEHTKVFTLVPILSVEKTEIFLKTSVNSVFLNSMPHVVKSKTTSITE